MPVHKIMDTIKKQIEVTIIKCSKQYFISGILLVEVSLILRLVRIIYQSCQLDDNIQCWMIVNAFITEIPIMLYKAITQGWPFFHSQVQHENYFWYHGNLVLSTRLKMIIYSDEGLMLKKGSFGTLYSSQLTLSTQLIIPNYPVTLSHQYSTTVSLGTYNLCL